MSEKDIKYEAKLSEEALGDIAMFGMQLPEPPNNSESDTVMLSFVIEAAISHSYREFQVLSQLLQNSSIPDRQVALVSFADSMLDMSVKLLDVVKWLETGKQVERYKRICYYLDQRSEFYADTANALTHMRDQLIFARMPFLQVPPAVDVLCSGTFIRLPAAIKERFVGPPEMTELQEKLTLKWLSNLIKYRLIQEASLIPKNISEIQIKDGLVTFTVPRKFSFTMTLDPAEGRISRFGDDPILVKWRWRLLKVDVLMPEPVIGFGSSLLAPEYKQSLFNYCHSQLRHDSVDIYFVHEALNGLVIKMREKVLNYREQRRNLSNSHCFFLE